MLIINEKSNSNSFKITKNSKNKNLCSSKKLSIPLYPKKPSNEKELEEHLNVNVKKNKNDEKNRALFDDDQQTPYKMENYKMIDYKSNKNGSGLKNTKNKKCRVFSFCCF